VGCFFDKFDMILAVSVFEISCGKTDKQTEVKILPQRLPIAWVNIVSKIRS